MARQQDKSVLLYSGVTAPTIGVEEASGTVLDWYDGDLIKFDGSGLVVIASAAKIAGIATIAATGTVNTALDMELLDINALYLITAASAVASAQAFVGESFDLNFAKGAGTAGHYVDTGSTNGEVDLFGIYPGDVDVNGGRYILRFNYIVFAQSGA